VSARTFLIVVGVLFGVIGGLCEAAAAQGVSSGPASLPSVENRRLGNGLRIVYLPGDSPSSGARGTGHVRIAFGYTAGLRDESGHPSGMSALAHTYLTASPAARAVALATHYVGGVFEFSDELDLVGMHLNVPAAALENILGQIACFFRQGAVVDPELLEYARLLAIERARTDPGDFELDIDSEIHSELLGEHPYRRRPAGQVDDIGRIDAADFRRFYSESFGTDRGFVIASAPISDSLLESFTLIEARDSVYPDVPSASGRAETVTIEFPSRPIGAVILSTAVPGVHFQDWFTMLVLDGLMRRVVAPDAVFDFPLALDPFLHRMEIEVEIPRFAEDVRDDMLDKISDLQFRSARPDVFRTVKRDALEFLSRRSTLEWFAANDLWSALEAGWTTIGHLSPDGLRGAARDMVQQRRVVALWSAAFEQPSVVVESLNQIVESPDLPTEPIGRAPGRVDIPIPVRLPFDDSDSVHVEKLMSGITLAAAPAHKIFLAGRFDGDLPGGLPEYGSNGVLWSFARPPDAVVFEALGGVRPDRILVFLPASALDSERARFESWTSGPMDSTPSMPTGSVATGDVPGLLVLKMWLDGKVIEAGWWGQVNLRIEGIEGSRLVIDAGPDRHQQVREWIRQLAEEGIEESEFLSARTAAGGYFDRVREELQVFLWQRDAEGSIQPPGTVSLKRLRDVARIYFQ
jgi:hypothetical protein